MTLMFNKQQVEEAKHPLTRILRNIFYTRKITLDQYSTLFAQHGKRLGLPAHIIHTNRNNSRKALNRDVYTFALFRYTLLHVLYLDIVDFSVTVLDVKTGEKIVYSSNDPVE